MDFQSNNQSDGPDSSGNSCDNSYSGKDPYGGSSFADGTGTHGSENPYDGAPVNSGNLYRGMPAGNENPYGSAPAGSGNPYGNTPADNGGSYAGNPYQNNSPYPNGNTYNNPYNGNSYNGSSYNGNSYNGNSYNGNPYNGNPYNNNPYNNNPYNGNSYYNGGVSATALTPYKPKGNGMAAAAMILGIICLVSLLLLRVTVPFMIGGIGIILAILSRGRCEKMLGKAKAGIICCISALVLDVALCAACVYLVFALPDIMPEMVDEVNQMCEERYGMSYDELMDEIYEMWDMER